MKKFILLVSIVTCLTACDKKKEDVVAAPVAAASEPTPDHVVTPEEKLDALGRQYRIDKVCYNLTKEGETFFLHFTDINEEGTYKGWYYIDKVPFYFTQANMAYTRNMSDDKLIKVYPDVTGLTCKSV